jgi:hypothetical protein
MLEVIEHVLYVVVQVEVSVIIVMEMGELMAT